MVKPSLAKIIQFAFLLFLCFVSSRTHAQTNLSGVVVDQQGNAIPDAQVSIFDGSKAIAKTRTSNDGAFVFAGVPSDAGKLIAKADGFAPYEQALSLSSLKQIRIVLLPLSINEEVTVTAARIETRLGETPSSVIVLTSNELSSTSALTLDDALRQIAGFSLLRRSGSRTANPTSQGASLRATGASGASRALVLADGVPLNDPFGGWVYWSRVPRESIKQVEVLRSGASSLYGSAALGGVVNVLTKNADDGPTISLEASAGNSKTFDGSLFTGYGWTNWSVSLAAESFRTGGYVLVEKPARGPVDVPADSRNSNLTLTLERSFSNGRFFIRPPYFGESRVNGTPLQRNRTHTRQLTIGGDWTSKQAGSFTLRSYASTQVYDQTFTAISVSRNSEALTRLQRVPSQSLGFSLQWSRALNDRHVLVAGFETKEIRGASDEIGYTNSRPTSLSGAGGRERTLAFFAQDLFRISPRLILNLSGRVDHWRNYDALSVTRPFTINAQTVNVFPDRNETAFSPNVAARFQFNENIAFNFSATRAFRAPTLNELYRSFRVGDALTLANENLRAERLTGFESGTTVTALNRRLFARANVFWTSITRTIANVTTRQTPTLITRQRQNLGRTRSSGIELESEARITKAFTLSGSYLFAATRVVSFPANVALEGLQIPQTPRHQFTIQARYSHHSCGTFALQSRISSAQFEDDQNTLKLERFFTLDAFASHRISKGLEIFVAAENLFNTRYSIGRTPVRTVGPPFFIRMGFRFQLQGKK